MKTSDLKLGYLLVTSPVPNVFIGGLMVTDSRGLPVEFRYTEPIQPTKIQQVLYGQVLSAYIKREVILETLLKNLESKFKCLLVEDEHLMDYAAKGYPIVRISSTKSSPIGPVGQTQEIAPGEVLVQITAESSPVRVNVNKPQKSEGGPTEASDPLSLLLEAGEGMDITEPLRRVQKALEIICQEAGISAGIAPASNPATR
ncbi:hypothetical protein [Vampirovibrio sp.]|uniref:hypothetical protein n=1 Tax=Vampirovibrio sp. TaxID=2717857 RepID=UPI003593AD31